MRGDVVELPYLRVANVQDGHVDTTDMKTVRVLRSEVETYLIQAGDVVMTEGGDFDKLGRGAVWDGRIHPCLHQNHVFRVRCVRDELRPEFFALLTTSSHGRRYFLRCAKQTTNLASINSRQLKRFPVPRVSVDVQDQAIAQVAAVERAMAAERDGIAVLRDLQRGLSQDLLTGRKRLPAALIERLGGPG